MSEMTLDQAMHELRKAQKGMRRLQRRLTVAEGLLAKVIETNDPWYARKTFFSRFKREDAAEKFKKHQSEHTWGRY